MLKILDHAPSLRVLGVGVEVRAGAGAGAGVVVEEEALIVRGGSSADGDRGIAATAGGDGGNIRHYSYEQEQ